MDRPLAVTVFSGLVAAGKTTLDVRIRVSKKSRAWRRLRNSLPNFELDAHSA